MKVIARPTPLAGDFHIKSKGEIKPGEVLLLGLRL
jgi:hypothetical protein